MKPSKKPFFHFYLKENVLFLAVGSRFKTKLFRISRRAVYWLFGRRKTQSRVDFAKVSSILIRPGGGVGDAVALTHALAQLKEAYPNVRLGVLVTPRDEAVFAGNQLVDEILPEVFCTYWTQRARWEVFIDFLPFFSERNIFCDFLLSPRHILAMYKNPADRYFVRKFKNYDTYCPFDFTRLFALCLEKTPFKPYLPIMPVHYTVPVCPKAINKANTFWQPGRIRVLVNSSGTFWTLKQEDFNFLLKSLVKYAGNQAEFLLLNTPQNKPFASLPGVRLLPQLDGKEFIALCAGADILITPDTSLVHLSGAFNKRAILFYANTPHQGLWMPLMPERQHCFILSSPNSPLSIPQEIQEKAIKIFNQLINEVQSSL